MRRMSFYEITLDETETATLLWLSERGYDASFHVFCDVHDDGTSVLLLDSSDIESCQQAADDDHHAFLSCNGSKTLAEKLSRLLSLDKTLITGTFHSLS